MSLKDSWIDKKNGIDDNNAEDINQVAHAVIELEKKGVVQGEDGATFIPDVSTDGVISWTNDKQLPNPPPVNIKGEEGQTPYIQNSYWHIGNENTGIKAEGVDGKDGTDGKTPVKGTDYWTDADKAEMVNDVIAALPVYNGEVTTV